MRWKPVAAILFVIALIVALILDFQYNGLIAQWTRAYLQPTEVEAGSEDQDDHSGHDHGSHENSLHLTEQARKNLGLTAEYLRPIELETFYRTLSVPGIIVERPGKTRLQVATPLTGIVTDLLVTEGETVSPGTPLFRLRLTHEDLVQTQTQFLQTLGERDVERREVTRLEGLSESGAVAGRLLLERQYAVEKLEALLQAQREALRLHGLTERHLQEVESTRKLLQELEIVAPSPQDHDHDDLRLSTNPFRQVSMSEDPHEAELIILHLRVARGQSVQAGETLCELADYSQLRIEGKAFEKDADAIARAEQQGWKLNAVIDRGDEDQVIENLPISYVANAVNEETRTLPFYSRLRNVLVRDEKDAEGKRFISWKYRLGQRLRVFVPVEVWEQQFVLPNEAVVREGADYFVFRENGDDFEQVPVHVKYRDSRSSVIANDGSIFPGDVIARRAAHQMQMAIKNAAGGGVDPHAGHNH